MINKKVVTIASGSFLPEIGGPSSYLKAILPALVDRGFLVNLITRSKKSKYLEDKDLPFKIYRIKNWPLKPLNYFRYVLKLFKVAKDSDIIYAQGPVSSGYPVYLANKFLKKKFVVKITGDYAWEQHYIKNTNSKIIDVLKFQNEDIAGKIKILKNIQIEVCKMADKVIVPSQFLAKLVSIWGISQEKINVIYNGTDFKPLKIDKEKARKIIGIPGTIILSCGRLVPWKGFKMLIKLMPEILKLNQFIRLIIVGDGPEKEKLERIKNNLGLNNKVYLVGKKSQEELKIYLASADLFVLNTAYEGFSHQILEAMACGLPVITTNVGGNPEIIEQGENGFMVSYNDELNLFEAIKTIFEYQDIKDKFIENGIKTSKKFTVKKMIEDTVNFLQQ